MNIAESITRTNTSPVIHTEYNGVQVTITFDESAGDKDIKQVIMDILTNAYENRLVE